MNIGQVRLSWLGHAGFLIKNSKTIYIDPYNISEDLPKADIILLTHGHYDHCSVSDLKKIVQEGTKIIATADCQSKILKFDCKIGIEIISPWEEIELGEIKISAIPAYNIDKPFHPKEEEWVGYLIKMNDLLIYHAGDSDDIPEMQKLTGYKQPGINFICLFPVGGRFTMCPEEAFDAIKKLKPTLAIPMHYGSVSGTEEDAEYFFDLCKEAGISARILQKE
jgi:L-ascorbate metabolism protein UlaG (beta-lactamase superfamily)